MLRPNEGSSLKEDYDIVAGNPIIDYYESIESPSISMTITFIDIDQVIGRKGITGGEYIDVIVKTGDDDADDFKITAEKQKLMLNSVRNMVTESNKQVATLEFVSVESIVNETARVNKKYVGNVSDTVFELLIGDKKGIGTSKKLFGPKKAKLGETDVEEDRATNSYSFVGNLKRPFDTIQWLCPKAQSANKNFGFLFFETLDGYVFRSIEKLLEDDPIVYRKPEVPTEDDFRIVENNLDQTNNIGINLRMGMYANKTIFVDIENQTNKVVDYKISEMDLKKPPRLPNGLEDIPTRLMLRVTDPGAMQSGSKKDDTQEESELDIYKNKSYARNNLLFAQSLSIVIPFNPDLRAGYMIDVKLPLRKSEDEQTTTYGTDKDNDISGKYMISELKHSLSNLDGSKATTRLKLVRDTFTA
jgi:hypothetical protein